VGLANDFDTEKVEKMAVETRKLTFRTNGEVHLVNITGKVARELKNCRITDGIVNIHVPGATGLITTIEYEHGLVQDFPAALERLYPKNIHYVHHDDNGHSHIRAAMVGPSLTVPFNDRRMLLGTWQQIIFGELDTRPRTRTVYLQIIGD